MDLFNQDLEALKKVVSSYKFTDEGTLAGIKEIDAKFDYVACPHTAITNLAIKKFREENPEDKSAAVFLSTAHACKFPDIFPSDIAAKIEIPEQVKSLESRPKRADELGIDFDGFKAYLLKKA
ncbi:hypothetical protein [Pedobacter sp. MW01-1-1]|uniref:hypothetical protein n=1 Tax=Pedobacter sp. MW01-1-1 TaxID=3383027 RepID=UPI003FF0CCF2